MKTFSTEDDKNDDGPNSGNDCTIVGNDGYWEDEECGAFHQFVCMWIKGKIPSNISASQNISQNFMQTTDRPRQHSQTFLAYCFLFTRNK